jgi:hypothetical protein
MFIKFVRNVFYRKAVNALSKKATRMRLDRMLEKVEKY